MKILPWFMMRLHPGVAYPRNKGCEVTWKVRVCKLVIPVLLLRCRIRCGNSLAVSRTLTELDVVGKHQEDYQLVLSLEIKLYYEGMASADDVPDLAKLSVPHS